MVPVKQDIGTWKWPYPESDTRPIVIARQA
jgi:hypothetical protein